MHVAAADEVAPSCAYVPAAHKEPAQEDAPEVKNRVDVHVSRGGKSGKPGAREQGWKIRENFGAYGYNYQSLRLWMHICMLCDMYLCHISLFGTHTPPPSYSVGLCAGYACGKQTHTKRVVTTRMSYMQAIPISTCAACSNEHSCRYVGTYLSLPCAPAVILIAVAA